MIRTIIACGIVPPMPTSAPKKQKQQPAAAQRAAAQPAAATPEREPLSLAAVVAEIQFFRNLLSDSPTDDRIPTLAKDLRRDFDLAMKALGFSGGDDLPEVRDPRPPEN
jgi:hypothetical protein